VVVIIRAAPTQPFLQAQRLLNRFCGTHVLNGMGLQIGCRKACHPLGGTGIVMRDGAFVSGMGMKTANLAPLGELRTNRRLDQTRYLRPDRGAAPISGWPVAVLLRLGTKWRNHP